MNNHRHDEFHGLQCFGMGFTLACPGALPARGYHGSWLRGVFKPALLPGRDRVPGFVLHDWRVRAGERQFWFSLVLFGRTVRYAEDWIGCLAAQAGTLDMAGAGPGRLLRVSDLATGATLYDNPSANNGRADGGFLPNARLHPMRFPLSVGESVRLRLVTPLVSKHLDQGDPLLSPLRTRLQRLVNDYGDGARIVDEAAPWRVAEAQLRTTVIPRSTEAPRKVVGRKGWLRLTHVTPQGALLLGVGGIAHVGGAASMGFGRYRCEAG